MENADFLPTDLAECQQLLLAAWQQSVQLEKRVATSEAQMTASEQKTAATEQQIAELNRVLDATSDSHQELRQQHAATLEELAWYKRWVHGRRSERIGDAEGQQHLFDLTLAGDADVPIPEESPEPISQETRRKRRRRRELDLSRLPHIRHESDLPEEEKTCLCCSRAKDRIGEDITKILEYVPSKLEVHEHVRPKFACRYCKDGVSSPPPPERPIARGIAGPGLITQIVVSKFGDHLPLYRQEDIFVRHGLHIARSTQCDWVAAAADLLKPLYDLQQKQVLQSSVMWTDDTPVTVLTGNERGSCKGRFWTYVGDEQHPYSVYDFTMSRRRDGPQSFLENYDGFLQADAYAGYDAIYLESKNDITEVACWAHARRKFFDALKNYPREAHQVLEWIQQLYDIEDRGRELAAAARRELRCAEANPVLDRIDNYLTELTVTLLPKSALAKAVTYARNQWNALRCYTTDGRLTIDNNTAERTLRHQAIGRKNWMFLGSETAGSRAAILYTILAGAKRHRLETWTYVRELLMRLHADDLQLEDMLPDRWAAANPESVLNYRLEESRKKAAAKRSRRQQRRRRSAHPSS